MASDEGPVETMPNMSPSCTSVSRDPLEQIANPAGVAEVEVQVVDDDQEDAAGGVVARARRRQDDAFLCRRRRRRQQVVDAAAVDQRQRRDVLLDAVLENLEVVLRQVGDELILAVADDRVHRDEVDGDAELWAARWLPGAARRGGQPGCSQERAPGRRSAAADNARASPKPQDEAAGDHGRHYKTIGRSVAAPDTGTRPDTIEGLCELRSAPTMPVSR